MDAKEETEKDILEGEANEKKDGDGHGGNGDLGEGDKSRKESQPLIVRDAIVEVIVEMFFDFFSFAKQVQTEKEWEKLIHTEGLVIVDIYCEWCFSAINQSTLRRSPIKPYSLFPWCSIVFNGVQWHSTASIVFNSVQ